MPVLSAPKKTIHVLNILLNYLFYINMVRDETVEKATQCTARYHELEANINQQKREMENHKIKINNVRVFYAFVFHIQFETPCISCRSSKTSAKCDTSCHSWKEKMKISRR